MVASLRLLFWAAVAAAVHELGHVAAVKALGGRVASLRLTGVGAVIRSQRPRLFSYWEECLVALAGPAASFLLAPGGSGLGPPLWWRGCLPAGGGVSLAFGVFNLLPVGPLDGGGSCGPSQIAGPGPMPGRRCAEGSPKSWPSPGRPGAVGAAAERKLHPCCCARPGCCGGRREAVALGGPMANNVRIKKAVACATAFFCRHGAGNQT